MSHMDKLILAIESSCDDTAAALVRKSGEVIAAATVGQIDVHAQYGGVFPELASRAHVSHIIPLVQNILATADISTEQLEAIAVTRGPGLIGSLLVGLNTASGLAQGWGVPVIGVNHLRGHLRSADLEEQRVSFPALVLLVSGGHSILALMESQQQITLLGTTRDDSVGEAYDKVARMLGLGFPGGPHIDRLATEGAAIYDLPRPMIREGLDFSFSGLKSAVARLLEKTPDANPADIAASFVASCMDILCAKSARALERHSVRSLVVVGGVAASKQLRSAMEGVCNEKKVSLCLPPLRWATDNAAMIGLAAWDYVEAGIFPPAEPQPNLALNQF